MFFVFGVYLTDHIRKAAGVILDNVVRAYSPECREYDIINPDLFLLTGKIIGFCGSYIGEDYIGNTNHTIGSNVVSNTKLLAFIDLVTTKYNPRVLGDLGMVRG